MFFSSVYHLINGIARKFVVFYLSLNDVKLRNERSDGENHWKLQIIKGTEAWLITESFIVVAMAALHLSVCHDERWKKSRRLISNVAE